MVIRIRSDLNLQFSDSNSLKGDEIRLAKITTKPKFENAILNFITELTPKAVLMKTIPM